MLIIGIIIGLVLFGWLMYRFVKVGDDDASFFRSLAVYIVVTIIAAGIALFDGSVLFSGISIGMLVPIIIVIFCV